MTETIGVPPSSTAWDRRRRRIRGTAVSAGLILVALGIGAIAVSILEGQGLNDASPTFLLAVVGIAVLRGTGPAIATAVGAFLLYDFFFIAPYHTFTVHDPAEWLNLLLLLAVGVVVGQLAGRERDRALAAIEGEREATAMFDVSFTLSSQRDTLAALGAIAALLRDEIGASRVWIALGDAVAADTGDPPAGPPPSPTVHSKLRRRPSDEPAEWVRVHAPGPSGRAGQVPAELAYRVAIAAGATSFGSLWALRPREMGDPDLGETRVMAAAADQIGVALERDRFQRDATSAEIVRRSEGLKSALLDSVSHDLRTPLASIRAAAGSLMDPEVQLPPEDAREIAASIDREADWLNRLVTNLLDMSRVDAGELRPHLAPFAPSDLVADAVGRASTIEPTRAPIEVDAEPGLPPVLVDEVFLSQILANVLHNAVKYAGPDAPIRASVHRWDERFVRITIEDGGQGVPEDALPRLFEKFYRVPRKGEGSRRGTGIGLAVVRGLAEAMGGRALARRSELGGLAIDIDVLVAIDVPAGRAATLPEDGLPA